MIKLNFSKIEVNEIQGQNLCYEDNDLKQFKSKEQFDKYRQYLYFKQKETKNQIEKSHSENESRQIEQSMIQKLKLNQNNLQSCKKEIVKLALQSYFKNLGTNVIFNNNKQNNVQNTKEDDYQDIQRHLTQTGLNLETYYQVSLNNNLVGWTQNQIQQDKQEFVNYFKKEIQKTYEYLNDDDIKILNLQDGNLVDFVCPVELENISIGKQKFDKIPKKSIIQLLNICDDYFDPDYDHEWKVDSTEFRENINKKKQRYYLPLNYTGLGLKILGNGKYKNDGWLDSNTSDAAWIVLLHSTEPQFVSKILGEGFKPDKRQRFEQD